MAPSRLLLLWCLVLSLPAGAQSGVTLDEPSAWVVPTPLRESASPRAEDAVSGIHLLLSEEQVLVGPEMTERYVRRVRQVVSARGISTGSEFRVTFSNTSQRLRLHGLWRTREGVRAQVLRAEDVKLLQQETGLDEGIYRDERTAVVFLPDVRVGDRLEEAYTVEDAHPLFRGQHMDRIELATDVPTPHAVHRLLAPASLKLHFKTHGAALAEPTVRELGELREYRWELRDVPAFTPEDGIPQDLVAWPYVQVSSYPSWAEVAAWALTLMDGLPIAPEVKARADTWRPLPTEEARFLAATRFVQDEVRYLGLEMGPNTHQPHAPGQVLAQRFGDCKDKAFLLAALLRELGIPAQVALVNTRQQGGIASLLPSAWAFNHAIVRAQVAGRTEWVDATRTHQRGRLGMRSSLPYGQALVVAPGVTGLEAIVQPTSEEPMMDVRYTLAMDDSGTGTLGVTVRAVREQADATRAWLADLSAEQLATQLKDQRRRLFPKLRAEAPPRVVDDEDANTVTWEERYALEDGWAGGKLGLAVTQMQDQFLLPRQIESRVHPLKVDHPFHLRVRWAVQAGSLGPIASQQETVQGPASRLDISVLPDAGGFTYQVEYQSLADRVAPNEVAQHIQAMNGMRPWLGLSFPAPTSALVSSASSDSPQLSRTTALAVSAVFFLGLAVFGLRLPQRLRGFMRARRSRAPVLPRVRYLRESESDAPVIVDSTDELEQRVRNRRCVCGGTLTRLPEAAQLQSTGSQGRSLTLVRVRCASCGTFESLAFDIRRN